MKKDPGTLALIIINFLYGVAYIVLFVVEITRSFIDFNRLKFSQKVNSIVSWVVTLVLLTLILTKHARPGGFKSLL